MIIRKTARWFLLSAMLASTGINASTINETGFINYTWMNSVINKTPAENTSCPSIDTDIYGAGFDVALQKGFTLSLGASGSKWFPKISEWASVGIAPTKNSFGVFFSNIKKLNELNKEKEKHLPNNFEELTNWKVSDSAYWESQGGVSFYLGTGIFPVDAGTFMIATGGWASFLQKTGPNKVYVELSRKKIRSLSFGVGILGPSLSVEKVFENSHGFAYEFTLDNMQNIEAFERFMAGDVTKAQELIKSKHSGISKVSDLLDSRIGTLSSFGISTPYIPIISYKSFNERAYEVSEESSVWDEKSINDSGIYIKQRNFTIFGQQINESRSFAGGKLITETKAIDETQNKSDKLYGNFKFSYRSSWGQELRLRKYLNKVQALTGLTDETCVRIPKFDDTLGFNQIQLEVDWSDSFLKNLIFQEESNFSLLQKIKEKALKFEHISQLDKADLTACENLDGESFNDNCAFTDTNQVSHIFSNIEGYVKNMSHSSLNDNKIFARNLSKIGEEIWKSPFVFKAFYEAGKVCGQEFKFEVSGQRLSRHKVNQKFINSAACESLHF